MQTLTAPPRDSFSADQVTALLVGDQVDVDFGCELLKPDLTVAADISADLAAGTVERNLYADIHGTCRVDLSRELVWGVDLIRPYMLLTAGGVTARFNTGVFCLATPEHVLGEDPPTFQCTGYDRLYLLNRQVGASYTVAAGATYYAALTQVFTDAGLGGVRIDSAAAALTLPAAKTWPLVADSTNPDQTTTPVTWLRVVNELLTAINFRAVWADENGLFRCSAYQPPVSRAPEWTFDADSARTIVGEDRTYFGDVWATPNRWVFRWTNRPSGSPTPTEGDGIYTVVNATDGPTSVAGRGLTWPAVIDYEAADQATLVALGNRKVAADRAGAASLKVTTGPFPLAGHADIYRYRDSALGADRRVQAVQWQQDLAGGDMTWVWEVVG